MNASRISAVIAAALMAASCEPPATETNAYQPPDPYAAPAPQKTMPTASAAPIGGPEQVAAAAIEDAGHPCGEISAAVRVPKDGSILAVCTNGERYRVFTMERVGTVAMKCSAAEKLGVKGC